MLCFRCNPSCTDTNVRHVKLDIVCWNYFKMNGSPKQKIRENRHLSFASLLTSGGHPRLLSKLETVALGLAPGATRPGSAHLP
jgi:hypothetical protein